MMTLIYTIIFRLLIKTSLLLMKIFWPIITIFRSYARICQPLMTISQIYMKPFKQKLHTISKMQPVITIIRFFQLVQLLREWLRLFSNRYYSFAFQDEGNSNSLLRFQNADDAVAIDPLIYNCFTTKERLKHYRFAVNLLKKRGHSLSPDWDKQLYYSFFLYKL